MIYATSTANWLATRSGRPAPGRIWTDPIQLLEGGLGIVTTGVCARLPNQLHPGRAVRGSHQRFTAAEGIDDLQQAL